MVSWGHRYLTVRPDEFRIDYTINPYMDPAVPPDPVRSAEQWQAMVSTLRDVGAEVEELAPPADCPDMVYAMNLGQAWIRDDERHVLMSHMRFSQRRAETPAAAQWFADHGFTVHWLAGEEPRRVGGELGQWGPADLSAPCFESGDAFWFSGRLIVAYGPRTDHAALERISEVMGVDVLGVHTTHPAMFHLDLSFCPLTETAALVCPGAFDDKTGKDLWKHVPDPIEVSVDQALAFAANAVVVGDTVVGVGLDPTLVRQIEQRGLRIRTVDVDQFHLSGGSVRCLTNPLDIVLS
ncbi:MAG: arginine deiminase-related protein [Propionibacteriales bacterium]|nr:arginine deiminase-related protein [Propionibacteriales bacterium]